MATGQLMTSAVARLAANPPMWSAQQRVAATLAGMTKVFLSQWAGNYRVPGTVKVAGTPDVPVVRLVCLIDKKSKRIVKTVWSDTSGNYSFDGVSIGQWIVTSHDHTGEYNAVIGDNVYGEPM